MDGDLIFFTVVILIGTAGFIWVMEQCYYDGGVMDLIGSESSSENK